MEKPEITVRHAQACLIASQEALDNGAAQQALLLLQAAIYLVIEVTEPS